MTRRFTRFARALASDERGMGLIEIAALAPFLALLAVGVIDITGAVTKRVKIQYAVSRTVELAAAHGLEMSKTSSSYDFDFYKTHAAQAAGISEDEVFVNAWLECNETEQAFASLCATNQTSARYLQVHVHSTYEPIFSIRALGGAKDSSYSIVTEAAVRIQ